MATDDDDKRARWLSLRVTQEVEAAITAFAEEDHRSKSAEIAWILEQYAKDRHEKTQGRKP